MCHQGYGPEHNALNHGYRYSHAVATLRGFGTPIGGLSFCLNKDCRELAKVAGQGLGWNVTAERGHDFVSTKIASNLRRGKCS